jgi:hypothetical protein
MGTNWEAVGAIAEIGGAIGVIATLVYLSIQIRHSSKSERASMQHAVLSEFRQLISQAVQDNELNVAYERYKTGQELPSEIRDRFLNWISNVFRVYEEIHDFATSGLISKEFWNSRRDNMKRSLAHPEVRDWWQDRKQLYSASFQQVGDQLIAELRQDA